MLFTACSGGTTTTGLPATNSASLQSTTALAASNARGRTTDAFAAYDAVTTMPTPLLDYAPIQGPLANAAFDSQAAGVGLQDASKTDSSDATNTINDTGPTNLGMLQTADTALKYSSIIIRFVADDGPLIYLTSRNIVNRNLGVYFNAGAGEFFDSYGPYFQVGMKSPGLTPGTTYYAKLDTGATATTTHLRISFLTTSGSVLSTQVYADSNPAAFGAKGSSAVEVAQGGFGVSQIAVYQGVAPNSIIANGGLANPSPTASPAPSPTPGQVAAALCIAQPSGPGLTYNLASHDEFDADVALNTGTPVAGDLNVSDTYGPTFLSAAKQTTWSNSFSFGRENGGLDGTDDSAYPSFADIATWQNEYGTTNYPSTIALDKGVGVQLLAYAAPVPAPSDVQSFLCGDGTCRHNLGGLMDGNINNAYEYGYWVYSAEVPDGRASAPGFWPSDWTLCETVCGAGNNYYEMDTFEVFSTLLGQGTFAQTLQPENPSASTGQSIGPGPVAGQQLDRVTNSTIQTQFHQYAELSSPTYVGFWFDNVAESGALNQVPAAQNPSNPGVNPIMVMQTCTSTSYCAPGVGPTQAPGVMTEQYYRHYAPSTVSCGPPYDVPAQPMTAPQAKRRAR
jgi:hypothetical protein